MQGNICAMQKKIRFIWFLFIFTYIHNRIAIFNCPIASLKYFCICFIKWMALSRWLLWMLNGIIVSELLQPLYTTLMSKRIIEEIVYLILVVSIQLIDVWHGIGFWFPLWRLNWSTKTYVIIVQKHIHSCKKKKG